MNYQCVTCILVPAHWFQSHPTSHSMGAPVEVRCKDLFEPDSEASFIPIQRNHGKFIPAFNVVQDENVLLVCPLMCKLQC